MTGSTAINTAWKSFLIAFLIFIPPHLLSDPSADNPETAPAIPREKERPFTHHPSSHPGDPRSTSIAGSRIPFVINEGQFEGPVRYYAQTLSGTVFVTGAGDMIYSMTRIREDGALEGLSFEEHLVGAAVLDISGEERAVTRFNSFVGNDPSHWRTGIATFRRLEMGDVYRGIGLSLKTRGDSVEKIFTVQPGADPGEIRIRITGTDELILLDTGELVLNSAAGSVSFSKPVAYQVTPAGREDIEIAYAVDGYEYGFRIGVFDHRVPLIIDPLLASTILGGWCDDICYGPFIETDAEGNVYLSGFTCTPTFPTTLGAYQREYAGGQLDCFISKFSNDLSTLLASTLLGGSGFETECSIALDAEGNIYAGGFTDSRDFPTTEGAYDPDPNGNYDIFVAKLDNDLTRLIASTYIGGSDNDGYESNRIDLAVGGNGDLYFAAQSRSSDFPVTPGAYDTTYNGAGFIASGDAVVVKMSGDLSELLASTYLGGNQDELRVSIALDGDENVFVCTGTYSSNLSTPVGAYDRDLDGSADVFISKLSGDLSTQLASTYLGHVAEEIPHVIRIDGNNTVYISGYTMSSNFPTTPGAYDEHINGGEDGFVSVLDNDLTALIASTFLGGSGLDRCQDLVVHEKGDIYVTGQTLSEDFPIIPGTYDDDYNGGSEHGDIFVSKLDNGLTRLEASTFLGGSDDEKPFGIAFDGRGNVFVGGFTHSNDYPTTEGAYDRSFGGIRDVVVAKLLLEPVVSVGNGNANHQPGIPIAIKLSQNYPNPFNPSTTITFEIPDDSVAGDSPGAAERGSGPADRKHPTNLTIYDSRGRAVKTLIDGDLLPGRHEITWDGWGDGGEILPSGIYFCSLRCDGGTYTRKISLLK